MAGRCTIFDALSIRFKSGLMGVRKWSGISGNLLRLKTLIHSIHSSLVEYSIMATGVDENQFRPSSRMRTDCPKVSRGEKECYRIFSLTLLPSILYATSMRPVILTQFIRSNQRVPSCNAKTHLRVGDVHASYGAESIAPLKYIGQ